MKLGWGPMLLTRSVAASLLLAALVAASSLSFAQSAVAQRRRRGERPRSDVSTGTLVIFCSHEDAEVLLDDESVGTTPVAPLTVSVGAHTLRVRLGGHTEFTDVVQVRAGIRNEVSVELVALSHVLTVTTDPAGAHIYVDDDFMGDTPAELDLVEGPHRLRLALRGYEESVREIEAVPGARDTLSLELVPLPEGAFDPLAPSLPWYEEPGPWIGIGAGVVAAATAIALIVYFTTASTPSEVSNFCNQQGGCILVQAGW